ncbi:hypothetical protein NXX78_09870 [Bacteroides fragilis]|nr:hypothetical protein [Bacteroides fragilis]
MIIYIKQANSQYINDTQGAAVFGAPIEKERTKGNSGVSITGSRSWLLRNSHIR